MNAHFQIFFYMFDITKEDNLILKKNSKHIEKWKLYQNQA